MPNSYPQPLKGVMEDFREADRKLIDQGLKSKDANDRRQAQIAKDRINGESSKIRDMRENLVRAHREGNKAEIADIHDYIKNKPEYKNGW